MEKRWNVLDAPAAAVQQLHNSLKINTILCKILVQRGIGTYDAAFHYFRPDETDLHSPWLMKDMDKAVDRVIHAIHSGEKILIYGDYDVDGTTATATVFLFLKKIHPQLDFYIPHRFREGYGLSKAGIDFAHANGFTLIITVDCGIKSVELVGYARSLGIDVVICDHHLPDNELPPANAILNAKQNDCNYPYKELCGCGVGFKLICALTEKLQLPRHMAFENIDLVATAIASDIVPVTGENRVMAYLGLKKVNLQPNRGIKALAKLAMLSGEMNITRLVFLIAPRVNAAGRMDDARKAVQMFIAETDEEAGSYASELHNDNTSRKETDSDITREALDLIKNTPQGSTSFCNVLYNPGWHKGVVGIVASRVIEHYYRPTIILTRSGDYATGSARSVPGFNLYEAVHACRHLLTGYGGHFAAAGLTLPVENIDALRKAFEAYTAANIEPRHLVPEIIIDAAIDLKDITPALYKIICQMEPFGPENMHPVFMARNVRDTGFSRIVKDTHLKLSVQQHETVIQGIGFGLADKLELLQTKEPVDIAFKIDENTWNGSTSLQIVVNDIRKSGT